MVLSTTRKRVTPVSSAPDTILDMVSCLVRALKHFVHTLVARVEQAADNLAVSRLVSSVLDRVTFKTCVVVFFVLSYSTLISPDSISLPD